MNLGPNATMPILVLMMTGTAAVPLGAAGIDALEADAHALADTAQQSVERALHDLSRLPLAPEQAHGFTEDGHVVRVALLVRATGDVDLDGLVVTQDADLVSWSVAGVLRDRDGSLEQGLATDGDLLRIDLDLSAPLAGGEATHLALHGDAPAEQWGLRAPHNLQPERVELNLA